MPISESKTHPPRPTRAELEILAVLWQRGPGTVREIHSQLEVHRPVGYTTALKLLQIMLEKGLVERDVSSRSHVYTALAKEQETRARLVDDIVRRAFGGSTLALIKLALESRDLAPDEVDEIRRVVAGL